MPPRTRRKKPRKAEVEEERPASLRGKTAQVEPRRAPVRGKIKMDGKKPVSRKRKQQRGESSDDVQTVEANGVVSNKKIKIDNSDPVAPAPVRGKAKPVPVPVKASPAPVSGKAKPVPVPVKASPAPVSGKAKISHRSHRNLPGQVMVMGQGDTGQLGLGEDIMERGKPCPVGGILDGLSVVDVVCGGMHTAALTADGKVYTWGCNDEGALGRVVKDGEEFSPGLVVEGLSGVEVVQISAGDSHTAALTAYGEVYCWGVFRDSNGPFGLVQENIASMHPREVYSCPDNQALKIASGCNHVVVLTQDGSILSFGCAEQGQLGRVHEAFCSRGGRKGLQLLLVPQIVRFRKPRNSPHPKFADIFCGSYHTFALSEDGAVYTWGLNNYGQLGTNDNISHFQPVRLPSNWIGNENHIPSSTDLMIAGGQHHTVLCSRGDVYAMGRREYGRLGLGGTNSEEPCKPTQLLTLKKAVSVSAGGLCSFAVCDSGEVYSWGMGTNLQLGTGQEEDLWQPELVKGKKLEGKKIVCVSAGGQHTAMLALDSC